MIESIKAYAIIVWDTGHTGLRFALTLISFSFYIRINTPALGFQLVNDNNEQVLCMHLLTSILQ